MVEISRDGGAFRPWARDRLAGTELILRKAGTANAANRSIAALDRCAGAGRYACVLLVTHQVNIAALTGAHTTSSELVIFKCIPDGSLSVAGMLEME